MVLLFALVRVPLVDTLDRLDRCLFPVTLPVTDGLGENAAGALNALVPVPVSGGGQCPCARGISIRMSLLPYSTVAGGRAPTGLHDALCVFEAADVDTLACDWGRRVRDLDSCTGALVMCVS